MGNKKYCWHTKVPKVHYFSCKHVYSNTKNIISINSLGILVPQLIIINVRNHGIYKILESKNTILKLECLFEHKKKKGFKKHQEDDIYVLLKSIGGVKLWQK